MRLLHSPCCPWDLPLLLESGLAERRRWNVVLLTVLMLRRGGFRRAFALLALLVAVGMLLIGVVAEVPQFPESALNTRRTMSTDSALNALDLRWWHASVRHRPRAVRPVPVVRSPQPLRSRTRGARSAWTGTIMLLLMITLFLAMGNVGRGRYLRHRISHAAGRLVRADRERCLRRHSALAPPLDRGRIHLGRDGAPRRLSGEIGVSRAARSQRSQCRAGPPRGARAAPAGRARSPESGGRGGRRSARRRPAGRGPGCRRGQGAAGRPGGRSRTRTP